MMSSSLFHSSPPAIRGNTLVRQPKPLGRRAGLIEHIDRDTAARIPIAADPEPDRVQFRNQPLGDSERALLMERAVVAKRAEKELQRLAFDQAILRYVIDHQMRKVRLSRD